MSRLLVNPRVLGRCGRCILPSSPASIRGTAIIVRQPLRHATTTAKPRAKKATTPSSEDVVSVPKKSLSMKSSAISTKSPRKKKADTPATEPAAGEAVAAVPKKNVRAASTKSGAVGAKKKAELGSLAPEKVEKVVARAKSTGPASAPATPSQRPTNPGLLAGAGIPPKAPKPVDRKSPEYKRAARKWTSLMVALPILVVTSWYLFDRLALGNMPKDLAAYRNPPPPPPPPEEVDSSKP